MSLFESCSASTASKVGNSSELSIILEFDATAANQRANCRKYPLHFACQGGFNDCAELLIDAKADVEAATVDGETALHFAARNGFASTCELLVRSGAALEAGAARNQATPLLLAVEAGHADATSVLLQLGANIKATSAGFPFGVERIMTSVECSETLANWKRRDQ